MPPVIARFSDIIVDEVQTAAAAATRAVKNSSLERKQQLGGGNS